MEKRPLICAGITPECPPPSAPSGGAEDMALPGAQGGVRKAWCEQEQLRFIWVVRLFKVATNALDCLVRKTGLEIGQRSQRTQSLRLTKQASRSHVWLEPGTEGYNSFAMPLSF